MKVDIIASSSKANAILIDDGHSKILLDCGLSYRKLAREVRPSSLEAVFVSHYHNDHCKSVEEMSRRGVNLLISDGEAEMIMKNVGNRNIYYQSIKDGQQLNVGSWIVKPFELIHDTPEPLGLLFQSTITGKKGIYLVDSGYVKYNFTGINVWLIEANYSEPLLEKGPYEDYLKDRVRKNHFSLEDLKTFLGDSDLSQTEEIYLLHLSSANADEQMFKKAIQRLTGKPVYTIADSKTKNLYPKAIP